MTATPKNHFNTRWLALPLAAALAITGCSSNNGGNAPTEGGTTEQTGGSAGPTEITLFVDATWYPYQDWTGPIPEAITAATGVRPKISVATDDKQLSLMVSSGDLPDLVLSPNWQLMSDANLSHAFNDLIPEYAPELSFDPIKQLVNTAKDGNYYTIRNDFSTEAEWQAAPHAFPITPGLQVRQDLMEEMGNPEIQTLDDLVGVLQQVKSQYPDMTPLVLNPNWTHPFFSAQFGAVTSGFADQEGQLIHHLRQPELMQSFLFINRLYREGLVTSENFAYKNEVQTQEMMTGGKGFAYTWTSQGADRLNAAVGDSGMTFAELADPLSPDAKIHNSGNGYFGLYVTKSNKHLEETMKLVSYLFSEEGWQTAQWGIEGEHWEMHEEGYPVFNYDNNDEKVMKELGVYWWGVPTETGVGMSLSAYNPGSETTRVGEKYREIVEYNPALGMVNPENDSDEQIIRTNIDNMLRNEITKIYLAPTEEEAVKAYEEIIAKADNIGMEKLEAWANSQYGEYKEQYDGMVN
ncbi:extracellular solute-binding protein [Paenibacillus daejeonensis]|uniref:extracellular solute-binding protein n=1 Tax=Paenibacillus daejeonensis TaxID=135193 RepID=UPI00037FF2C0|nr:extracellular solute-binding protein [Paenibacillus daejeonensis]